MVGSENGDVSIYAGKNVDIRGSDVIAGTGDVLISGENVTIQNQYNSQDYRERTYSEQKSIGISLGLTGSFGDSILYSILILGPRFCGRIIRSSTCSIRVMKFSSPKGLPEKQEKSILSLKFTSEDKEIIFSKYEPKLASELCKKIKTITDDLGSLVPNWQEFETESAILSAKDKLHREYPERSEEILGNASKGYLSLLAATNWAIDTMHKKYSELNTEALNALGNYFAYGWK